MYGLTNKIIHTGDFITFRQSGKLLDEKDQFFTNHCQPNLTADGRFVGAGLHWCSYSKTVSTKCPTSSLVLIADGSNLPCALTSLDHRDETIPRFRSFLTSTNSELVALPGQFLLVPKNGLRYISLGLHLGRAPIEPCHGVHCELVYHQLPQPSFSSPPPRASMSLSIRFGMIITLLSPHPEYMLRQRPNWCQNTSRTEQIAKRPLFCVKLKFSATLRVVFDANLHATMFHSCFAYASIHISVLIRCCQGQGFTLTLILPRLLYHSIETHVVPSSLIPMILRNLRVALFPKNSMGPPASPAPSPDERSEIRRRAASSMFTLMPRFATHTYYSTQDEDSIINTIEDDILRPFEDEYLNKHIVYSILELVLVRIMPELGEQPVSALLAERGVVWADVSSPQDVI